MNKKILQKLFQLIQARADEAHYKSQECSEPDYSGMDEVESRMEAEKLEKELLDLIKEP